MQDNNARGFYKTLFSCDKIYSIIKICAEMLNVFASYYVVIALSYIINSVICSVQINSLIIGLVTISLIYLAIRIILSILNATLSSRKTRILENDRYRKNTLFSKITLSQYEGDEVQKLISSLKYSEMNGSTALSRLLDAPMVVLALSISVVVEIFIVMPLLVTSSLKDNLISIFFVIGYSFMFILASKMKSKYMKRGVSSFSREGQQKLRKLSSHIDYQYDVKINPDIRFYNQKLVEKGAEEECELSKDIFSSYWNNISKGSFYSTLFRTLSFLLGICFVAYCAIRGRIMIGSLFVYSTLLENISTHIEKVVVERNVIKAGDSYFKKREELEHKVLDTSNEIHDTGKKMWNTLEFIDVSYSFPNSDRKTLDSLSFSISRNEPTAIVGLNGSGKSTILQLILKLRRPNEGKILIDGRDIWSIDDDEYLKLFSPMLQDSSLLSFALKDNLFLENNENECLQLMDEFGLSGIELDRVVGKEGGEEGSGLSGGQEKKMLLIRSLLMIDRYMILDEPTSASDSETEDLVFSSLKQRNGYLLVSHRISKLKNVSRIIVLKEGRIVSDGNWLEMTKNESLIKELLKCERRLYTRDSI